jgi:hypothetical protein
MQASIPTEAMMTHTRHTTHTAQGTHGTHTSGTQASRGGAHLSQAIPGYKGYSRSGAATRTDRVFSEEILSKLSEAVATVSRIKRTAAADLNPDVLASLDVVEEKAESLAQEIAGTAYDERGGAKNLHQGEGGQVMVLDSAIVERVGHVNQALASMDIEAGAGMASEDVDAVCDLLDDLKNSIKRREAILNSRVF